MLYCPASGKGYSLSFQMSVSTHNPLVEGKPVSECVTLYHSIHLLISMADNSLCNHKIFKSVSE